MPDYWITTHWPSRDPDDSPGRNVFYKRGTRKNLPRRGDVVFIYESAYAVIDGELITKVEKQHQNERETETLPVGRSAIISKVVVANDPRAIRPDDIVRDYGNLEDWMIIPCCKQTKVKPLAKQDLMELLGYARNAPPRFLTLWRIKDEEMALELLRKLEGI